MTSETAKIKVEMLDNYLSHTCQDYGERDHEAMMMAIKALEQEPCEDCISRQAVIEQINCWIGSGEYRYTNATHYLTRRMQDLPSVTPQPKTDVLDKIRAEIETKYGQCDICEYFENYDYEENDISEYRPIGDIADILQIIDKYKAESEG